METLIILLSLLFAPTTEQLDTIVLEGVDIVASMKLGDDNSKSAFSSTTIKRAALEHRHIASVKELSSAIPNFHQPDYGSRMTSSIYVRGFGSRIDQPVVGLNIDEIPVLNKNCYDFDFYDIDEVQIIRGAQSTLYGRNTAGGTINIHTMSPLNFQGKRLMLEYGNENNVRLKASHYAAPTRDFGWAASIYYRHSDGFFTNHERGDKCDNGDNLSMRLRAQFVPAERWSIDNTLSMEYVDEGGWSYRLLDETTGALAPVAYNDRCSYRRFGINDGVIIKLFLDDITLSSTTSYRFLHDRMRLDNDFLPLDYFTLGQYQHEHSFTQEIIAKSNSNKRLNWVAGVFAFYKHLNLDAPVHFKSHGIENLILKNANENFYHLLGPDYHLEFRDDNFPIEDKFTIPTFGTAAFGQLNMSLGKFDLSAGMRIDYESSTMDYNSYANINYKYKKNEKDFKSLTSTFKGSNDIDALELLPRFAITYNHSKGTVYASASKGFKSGGFNTQLFSDILRTKLTDDIMGNKNDQNASTTEYAPETSWNYELGTHLKLLRDGNLQLSAALFYIDCRDQQLTIFPKGESTGRMMSNAGHSHSYGAELGIKYLTERIIIEGTYGYTHATFDKYESGNDDYSGNYLPYAPQETMSANLTYRIPVPRTFANFLILNIGWNGTGRIYWNEDNTLKQDFYSLLSASLTWEKGHLGASVWGKNLLDEEYYTFYFKSIGNNFFAQGKPLQAGISLYINL